MSDNEFSENMVVCAVGNLSPGNISDSCESCPHNKFSFPGVLIDGVTKDAVMLLSEKVEIVPAGTKARLEKLEARNREMLEELEKQRNKHCFASSGVGNCDTCRDKQNCSLLRVINKAKGVQG